MLKRTAFFSCAVPLLFLALQPGPAMAATGKTPAETLRDQSATPDMIVIAHRGCWGEAPEVSIAAINACEAIGADAVEVDVRKTSDGALVLIHDETVDRTTNGTGTVADMTLAEIRKLRLRKGAGGPSVVVTDEHVPTLEEGLEAARDRFLVHLHLKTASHAEAAAVVKRLGMEGQTMAWMEGTADDPRQLDPEIGETIGLVPIIHECAAGSPASCEPIAPSSLGTYARYRPAAYFMNFRTTPDFIREVAAADRPAGARLATESLWRIDNEPREVRHAEWRTLIGLGVTMIMTDHPADLVAFLGEKKQAE